jgi:hypothetical protein
MSPHHHKPILYWVNFCVVDVTDFTRWVCSILWGFSRAYSTCPHFVASSSACLPEARQEGGPQSTHRLTYALSHSIIYLLEVYASCTHPGHHMGIVLDCGVDSFDASPRCIGAPRSFLHVMEPADVLVTSVKAATESIQDLPIIAPHFYFSWVCVILIAAMPALTICKRSPRPPCTRQ